MVEKVVKQHKKIIKNNLLGLGMVTQEAEPVHLYEFQASQGSIPKSKQTKITTTKPSRETQPSCGETDMPSADWRGSLQMRT